MTIQYRCIRPRFIQYREADGTLVAVPTFRTGRWYDVAYVFVEHGAKITNVLDHERIGHRFTDVELDGAYPCMSHYFDTENCRLRRDDVEIEKELLDFIKVHS